MLHSVKNLQGLQILSSDGAIGTLSEFYFDDDRWTIRYLVVDTGSWLPGRQVLISPIAIQSLDRDRNAVSLNITREQVKNSPDIDTHKPVSRQQEGAHFRYYGYPYYWGGSMLWGPAPYPSALNASVAAAMDAEIQAEQDRAAAQGDDHLRRTKEVIGYHIEAKDGELGHVADFLVDPESWAIRYFVVGTSNWWFGHKVLVSPAWVTDVRWLDKKVAVDLNRQSVSDSPAYDESAQFDREWEASYYAHHKKTPYWSTSQSTNVKTGAGAVAASTLVSLNDSGEFEVADDDQDPRGWQVAMSDGRLVGKVDDLILDTETMKVRYLDIDLDRRVGRDDADRHVLLPVKLAQVGERHERVTVSAQSSEALERAPAYRSLPVPPDYDERFTQLGGRREAGSRSASEYAAVGGCSISARKSTRQVKEEQRG